MAPSNLIYPTLSYLILLLRGARQQSHTWAAVEAWAAAAAGVAAGSAAATAAAAARWRWPAGSKRSCPELRGGQGGQQESTGSEQGEASISPLPDRCRPLPLRQACLPGGANTGASRGRGGCRWPPPLPRPAPVHPLPHTKQAPAARRRAVRGARRRPPECAARSFLPPDENGRRP